MFVIPAEAGVHRPGLGRNLVWNSQLDLCVLQKRRGIMNGI
jgi:hypothetical protein